MSDRDDLDGDGYSTCDGDCDDSDPNSTTKADDADCDGVVTAEDCDDDDACTYDYCDVEASCETFANPACGLLCADADPGQLPLRV
mgnify:CR=1 FL=1